VTADRAIYLSKCAKIGYSLAPTDYGMEIQTGSTSRRCARGVAARCISFVLATALLAYATPLFAEDGKTLKVCIPEHTASNAQLHQVATSISSHKPDKATHTKLQGVELLGLDEILHTDNVFKGNLAKQTLSTEARDRAGKEQCDYLLVISVPDAKTARSAQPNAWSPDQQLTTNTGDPYMRRQDPDIYVEVKYRLYHLVTTETSIDGFVATHQAAPQQAVVSQALDMLANQVFTKLTK